ncbi:PAS domain-containing protein [Citromicrobium bathyomarinum]|uniref:PAS domain-containing protein n=1 Tax=Citromicrobium bathyomarinum TaxID=72174 RepID=UPI00315A4ED9
MADHPERQDQASTSQASMNDPQARPRSDMRDVGDEDRFSDSSGVLFEQAMAQTRMAVCLSDPNQPDQPIVFANRAFRRLTGYDEAEILGRNCRFLQGPKTNKHAVAKVREAIENEDVVVVELLNYRKDGTPFWNALHLGPIYDSQGNLIYFFGSQWDVSDVRAARAEERHAREMARELSHRMKNMFAVISGIVNVMGRVRGVESEAAEINSRIQALGRAYETTLDEASVGLIDLGPAVKAILEPYDFDDRLEFLGNGAQVPFSAMSLIGLVLHELAANATRYGAWAGEGGGRVQLDWQRSGGDVVLTWIETGGPTIDGVPADTGTGAKIMDRMVAAARGSIERDWKPEGLHAVLTVPIEGDR